MRTFLFGFVYLQERVSFARLQKSAAISEPTFAIGEKLEQNNLTVQAWEGTFGYIPAGLGGRIYSG